MNHGLANHDLSYFSIKYLSKTILIDYKLDFSKVILKNQNWLLGILENGHKNKIFTSQFRRKEVYMKQNGNKALV